MLRRVLGILVLSAIPTAAWAADHRVLIFSVDGCRPDALQVADTPHLDALVASGAVSYIAESSHTATHSGPNYSSMLTGVDVTKHGVTTNDFSGSQFDQWPSLFTRLEAWKPELYTASLVQWGPINTGPMGIDHVADKVYSNSNDSLIAAEASKLLSTGDPDLVFVELERVDTTGHASGFNPAAGSAYVNAIHLADTDVGTVLDALFARAGYVNGSEEWLILATTDHGGSGTGHEPSGGAATWTTFYIANGPAVVPGADLGSPRVYDIAVTAMDYLGLDTSSMNLDGQSVGPAVPEPGVAVLAGLVLCAGLRRRRR